MLITSQNQLRALYGWPSGRAKDKVLSELEEHSKYFIECSPFFVLSTYGMSGKTDASPRGGVPGFVKILDSRTLLIPDAKGNNRVDSLVNIVETGNIGALFMIPGIDETLRINGTAEISTDNNYLNLFKAEKRPPVACIKINISGVFLHCAKALMRSSIWGNVNRMSRPEFPTMGKMLNDQLKTDRPLESQEEMIKRYQKDL
ncbi:MAG: MSMEG_1061 family FMN-dependent PPOX-type flavoprotein [Crocinitomicaceae bacterium]